MNRYGSANNKSIVVAFAIAYQRWIAISLLVLVSAFMLFHQPSRYDLKAISNVDNSEERIESHDSSQSETSDTISSDSTLVQTESIIDNGNDNLNDPCSSLPSLHYLQPPSKAAVGLASYPGSGNTWARHLIQSGTRVYTGSAYYDKSILKAFPGEEREDGSVSVVKTHYPCEACWIVPKTGKPISEAGSGDIKAVKNAIVYILRNPFDCILAEFNRKFTGLNHTGVLGQDFFEKESELWNKFVKDRIVSWKKNVQFYLAKNPSSKDMDDKSSLPSKIWKDKRGRDVLLVFYERLKSQLEQESTQIFQFLEIVHSSLTAAANKDFSQLAKPSKFPDPILSAKCVVANSKGGFRRSYDRKKYQPYSKEQIQMICADIIPSKLWFSEVWGATCGPSI